MPLAGASPKALLLRTSGRGRQAKTAALAFCEKCAEQPRVAHQVDIPEVVLATVVPAGQLVIRLWGYRGRRRLGGGGRAGRAGHSRGAGSSAGTRCQTAGRGPARRRPFPAAG